MAEPRPSTAEIAASIDGFYDDFAVQLNQEDSSSTPLDEDRSDLGDARDNAMPTLDCVQQEYRDLTKEHEDLCRRAKIVLRQRAQGRQRPATDPSKLSEADTRFRASLKLWPQIEQEREDNAARYRKRINDLQNAYNAKKERVSEIRKTFAQFCSDIARKHLQDNRMAIQSVTNLQEEEKRVAQEMEERRLKSVALESQRRLLEKRMTDRDKLGDGLHLMDFEQLKIENQTLHEKIDERNQELMQLKKKTSTVVQVLTHVCEKRHFVEAEIDAKKALLDEEVEDVCGQKARLQQRKLHCGLMRRQKTTLDRRCLKVTHKPLLKDIQRLKEIKVALIKQLALLKGQ